MKGKLVIFSAPSGSGKTSIVKALLEKLPKLEFSVSATSRPPRKGEENGKDYYFLSPSEFRQKIENDEFAEWEEVYSDNYYGTLKSEIQRIWDEGKHVIFDVDVVGGLNLKKKYGERALAVFVSVPSLTELENRLRNRSTESEEALANRIAKAKKEISYSPRFDEIILNRDLDIAVREAEVLVRHFLG